jgi:hypothetical protein
MPKATPDRHGAPRETRATHARATLWRHGARPHPEVRS